MQADTSRHHAFNSKHNHVKTDTDNNTSVLPFQSSTTEITISWPVLRIAFKNEDKICVGSYLGLSPENWSKM